MKICPVCNDSFTDELNFCDIDGTRLTREGSAHERNKWWSLLGAGLLVGALVITAASIFFLPKARLAAPLTSPEPQSSPAAAKAPAADSAASVAAAVTNPEPDTASADAVVPEIKKRDKALANSNAGGATLNPKAAAQAAEDADKRSQSTETETPPPPKRPEPPPVVKTVSDTTETGKPQPAPELKREPKSQPAIAKTSEKDSKDKKKNDDKDKKKGGFLRVFKKIFGKD